MVMLSERLADTSFAALVALDDVCNLAFNDIEVFDDDVIENGNVWCGKCGQPRLSVVETENGKCIFPIVHEHDLHDLHVRAAKKKCFAGEWEKIGEKAKIENADADTPREHIALVNSFCDGFTHGKGLLLYGLSGRGKTFLAACICNKLTDKKTKCKMASIHSLIAQMFEQGEKKTLNELSKFDLVVLDDFGVEKLSEYNIEKTYAIVDGLYKADVSMIVTTNLSKEELSTPRKDYVRIIERLKERCERFEIAGVNRRQGRVF